MPIHHGWKMYLDPARKVTALKNKYPWPNDPLFQNVWDALLPINKTELKTAQRRYV